MALSFPQIQRDADLGVLNLHTSRERPWLPAFHLDALAISSKRVISHAGTTLGGLYKDPDHTQSELKLSSMVVAQCKDHIDGQREMLGNSTDDGGIACEICELDDGGAISINVHELTKDGEDDLVLVNHCKPLATLDFAGVRCNVCKKGKAAALCGCKTLADLRSYPGDNNISALPEGDTVADYHKAVKILQEQCNYGTAGVEYLSLEAAGHFPPSDWDPVRDGPWECMHCHEKVWRDWQHFSQGVAEHEDLKRRAADDDKEAKALLKSKLKAHADAHFDQLLLERLVVRLGTSWLIVDPMHGLELNVAKTGWKYTIGDRMLEPHRERVAEYLNEIDCPLDVREKRQA